MDLRELGYLVLQSKDLGAWQFFAEQVAGMQTMFGPAGELYLKIDKRHHRIVILPADREAFIASGWGVRSKVEFDVAREELSLSGTVAQTGNTEDCAQRKVREFFGSRTLPAIGMRCSGALSRTSSRSYHRSG